MTGDAPLRACEWEVRPVARPVALALVVAHHYAGGGANTGVAFHGLFRRGEDVPRGVAWWLPPTKAAALATYPADWRAVLALSRLVIAPGVPTNAATFLLGRSVRLLEPRWRCLVTYADEWQGHTGGIYRAANWAYCGRTEAGQTWTKDGRLVARKAGPKTRTVAEMLALGCVPAGRHAKHKYILLRGKG